LRFPIAGLVMIILEFIVVASWAIIKFLHTVVQDELKPLAASQFNATNNATFLDILNRMDLAFGVVIVFLMIIIIIVFVVDSLRQDPDPYYKGGNTF